MSRKWIAVVASLTMVVSTTAFAQGESGSAPVPADQSLTPNAPMPDPSATPGSADQTTSPNAPVSDEGPMPAGDQAGTPTAAAWTPSVTEIAVAGAVAVGAAICIATCGGSSNTSTTTTTSPK